VKRLILFITLLSAVPAVRADIFTTVYLADGSTPLELADPNIPFVYRPIMAGTQLAIIIHSTETADWYGELSIWDADRDYGALTGVTVLTEAGEGAWFTDVAQNEPSGDPIHDAVGFQLYGDPFNSLPGDWFIVDYNAISDNNCVIQYYDFTLDEFFPLYQLSITQVKTRDFNNDGIVNFQDFAVLGQNWRRTGCLSPGYCSGTDLEEDGDVDLKDLMQFADFWLERTR
jgi:hypothetical protein